MILIIRERFLHVLNLWNWFLIVLHFMRIFTSLQPSAFLCRWHFLLLFIIYQRLMFTVMSSEIELCIFILLVVIKDRRVLLKFHDWPSIRTLCLELSGSTIIVVVRVSIKSLWNYHSLSLTVEKTTAEVRFPFNEHFTDHLLLLRFCL